MNENETKMLEAINKAFKEDKFSRYAIMGFINALTDALENGDGVLFLTKIIEVVKFMQSKCSENKTIQ